MNLDDEVSMGDALNKMFSRLKLDDEVKQQRIEMAWNRMMGETIKKRVSRLLFKKGELVIFVTSSALRQELFMNRYQLRDRINEELKETWVKTVILK